MLWTKRNGRFFLNYHQIFIYWSLSVQIQVSENSLDKRSEQRWWISISSCKLSTQELIWQSTAQEHEKWGQRGAEELIANGCPAASQGFISSLTVREGGDCFAAGSCSSLWLLASQMFLGHFSLQIQIKISCAVVLQKWYFTFLWFLVLGCFFKGFLRAGFRI